MDRKANILVVDDQYDKVKNIISLLGVKETIDFEHVTNSKDALRMLKTVKFDIIIIDLQIPEALGEEINPNGGRKLLEYIDQNTDLNRPTHILGLTSHIDSYNEAISSFQSRGWSLILGMDDKELIKNIISAKVRHAVNPPKNYEIAILTALEKTELQEVLKLPCNWIPLSFHDDCNIYNVGEFITISGKRLSIIATACQTTGIAQAASMGMKICLKFKPKFVIMTGIAAGIKGKVNLGDILVADPCWEYGSGKQTIKCGKPVFLSAPRQLNLDTSLRTKIQRIAINRTHLDDIYNDSNQYNRPNSVLNVHIGPVASGAAVIEDPSIVEMIKTQHRETIGVEMEAYGLALAVKNSEKDPPKFLIVKSVCDFADIDKNDNFQTYAAHTSARFVFKLLENEIIS